MYDSSYRTVSKTITWRLTGSLATFSITYVIVGDVNLAGSVAMIQVIANTALYYLHERVWNKINWGKK